MKFNFLSEILLQFYVNYANYISTIVTCLYPYSTYWYKQKRFCFV